MKKSELTQARAMLKTIRREQIKDAAWCEYERQVLSYLEAGEDWARIEDKRAEYGELLEARRLAKIRPLGELAQVFRAQQGDREAQAVVSVDTASMYEHASTFTDFLAINRLPVFERELRGWPA